MRKPHKGIECPCTDCVRWSANQIATLTARAVAAEHRLKEVEDLLATTTRGYEEYERENERLEKERDAAQKRFEDSAELYVIRGDELRAQLRKAFKRIAALEKERDELRETNTTLRTENEMLKDELELVTAPHDSVGAVIKELRAEAERLRLKRGTGEPPEDAWYWILLQTTWTIGHYSSYNKAFSVGAEWVYAKEWAGPIRPPEDKDA